MPGPRRELGTIIDRAGDRRFAIIVCTVAMLALLFGTRHNLRNPTLGLAGWTLATFLCLPLATAVLLDMRRRALPLLLACAGLLAALTPLVAGSWSKPARAAFKQEPGWLFLAVAVAIPLLVLAAWRGGVRLGRWGALAGDWRWWLPRTLALMLGTVLLVVFWVWLDPKLREYYPSYDPGRTDMTALLGWCGAMALYMLGWEFYWRGFLLFGIGRSAGVLYAVLFQSLPFFLTHRGKPETEMVASFFGGALLALFCWRARSFWPAALLHITLNTSIQLACFYW